jgi:hypothetical protein
MNAIGREGGGGMVLAARSCLHALGPECKDNVRAVLFPTGYLLTPMDVIILFFIIVFVNDA